jgi:hypothetical protein
MAALGLLDDVRAFVGVGGGKLVLVVDVGEGLHQPDGGHGASVSDVLGSTLLIFFLLRQLMILSSAPL